MYCKKLAVLFRYLLLPFQATCSRYVVAVSAFWRRRVDASLDAIKGMRCRKTGEHFGEGCSKQQGISLARKMDSSSTNFQILGAEVVSRETSLLDL